ncbi:MAG: XdhC family protein, partial [Acidimicrobiia bacterium]
MSTGEPPRGAGTPIFDALEEALRAERPAALATVVDGPGLGAKLLVRPDLPTLGTLGNPDLDRVVRVPSFLGEAGQRHERTDLRRALGESVGFR